MTTIIILFTALLPVGILAFYIWRKDRRAPEPVTELLKAFGLGVLSTLLSFCLSVPFGAIGLYPADAPGVPIGSIMLQWNEWKIGDTQADFLMTSEKSRYGEKSIYCLTPTGEILHIYKEKGLMGISYVDFVVEKSQAQVWLKQLEEWKKKQGIQQ